MVPCRRASYLVFGDGQREPQGLPHARQAAPIGFIELPFQFMALTIDLRLKES
jgi:hypothetical protein